jgi:hypothetical protein
VDIKAEFVRIIADLAFESFLDQYSPLELGILIFFMNPCIEAACVDILHAASAVARRYQFVVCILLANETDAALHYCSIRTCSDLFQMRDVVAQKVRCRFDPYEGSLGYIHMFLQY